LEILGRINKFSVDLDYLSDKSAKLTDTSVPIRKL
jgi:hypothetical protein